MSPLTNEQLQTQSGQLKKKTKKTKLQRLPASSRINDTPQKIQESEKGYSFRDPRKSNKPTPRKFQEPKDFGYHYIRPINEPQNAGLQITQSWGPVEIQMKPQAYPRVDLSTANRSMELDHSSFQRPDPFSHAPSPRPNDFHLGLSRHGSKDSNIPFNASLSSYKKHAKTTQCSPKGLTPQYSLKLLQNQSSYNGSLEDSVTEEDLARVMEPIPNYEQIMEGSKIDHLISHQLKLHMSRPCNRNRKQLRERIMRITTVYGKDNQNPQAAEQSNNELMLKMKTDLQRESSSQIMHRNVSEYTNRLRQIRNNLIQNSQSPRAVILRNLSPESVQMFKATQDRLQYIHEQVFTKPTAASLPKMTKPRAYEHSQPRKASRTRNYQSHQQGRVAFARTFCHE